MHQCEMWGDRSQCTDCSDLHMTEKGGSLRRKRISLGVEILRSAKKRESAMQTYSVGLARRCNGVLLLVLTADASRLGASSTAA